MDLEIVGRHALLFDDDATAEVVNNGGSLVPWAAAGAADLLLDRHDVRHLLDRVPPRPRRPYSAALLSAPSPDGVSEAELDRERFLDLPADDGGGESPRDASPSGNGTDTGQADYNAVPFSYGNSAGSDDPNNSSSHYRPSFPVPESLLNKMVNGWSKDEVRTSDAHCFLTMYVDVRNRQPPSEKVHQIIARTALFVSEHGGQSEIVLRVKQGSNPTFGFLMPDHHLHSYFRYLVDHPQLLKDGADAGGINKGYKTVNSESEHAASSGGALSLLGAVYESGDEDEGMLPASSKGTDPGNDLLAHEQGHEGSSFVIHDNKEVGKGQTVTEPAATAVKDKPIFTKNPMFTANSIVAAHQEKVKGSMTKSTTAKSQNSKSGVSDTKEVILEPPSFLKRTMEKIVEFIIRNGKEFEEKLIEQDRTTGRFPFLLPSNPYHSYYLKILQETQESKSHGGSSEHKDRRSSSERKDISISSERKDRSSSERKDRSSSERKDSDHGKEGTKSKARASTSKDSSASERSSEEPSEKQFYDKQVKGKFQMVIGGVKKEPPRKVTADEAAAIVMAATRGLGPANSPPNILKDTRDIGHTRRNNGHTSSFGSFSSLQDPDAAFKPASNSEAETSLTSSGQLKKEGIGIIDDDWIANTIAKAAAVAASKEADSSEASMTKEQKLKAERLRRAKMFAAIIKSGVNKMTDLATTADPTNEPAKASPADLNLSVPDPQPSAEEREGSSVPFEREGSNLTKQEKDSDDEQNRACKYRKKHHSESDEKDDLGESYKHSRKKHRSEHSRGHSKDADKHKHRRHSKDRESRHHRHHHSSSEDEREHRSSKSWHRHRDDDHYPEDDEHRRSHRHRKDHRSSSKRKHEDDRDHSEQTLGRPEASQSTSGHKLESEKPPSDSARRARSSQATTETEVPNELRAKIRAMLLETL